MYSKILHATDLNEQHYPICQQAASLASLFQAKLYLLHVIEPPKTLQLAQSLGFAEFDKPVKDNAITVMKLLGESLNVPVSQQFVEIGSIKMIVLEKAKQLGCELIIIGSHHETSLPLILGSTAHAVVNHAPCDVLTLRV